MLWDDLLIILASIAALLCDNMNKLLHKDVKLRSLWLPLYACNALYLSLACVNTLNGGTYTTIDGEPSTTTTTTTTTATSSESFLAILPCIAAIVAVMGCIRSATTTGIPQQRPPTTEYTSGLFSYMTFSYHTRLVKLALSKISLELEDVPPLRYNIISLNDPVNTLSPHTYQYTLSTHLSTHAINPPPQPTL